MVWPLIPYLTRPGSQGSPAGSDFPFQDCSPRGLWAPLARMVPGGQPRQECVVLPKSPEEGGARGQSRGMAVSSPTCSGGGKSVISPALSGPRPGVPRLGFVRDGLLLAGSQWSCVTRGSEPTCRNKAGGQRSQKQMQLRPEVLQAGASTQKPQLPPWATAGR